MRPKKWELRPLFLCCVSRPHLRHWYLRGPVIVQITRSAKRRVVISTSTQDGAAELRDNTAWNGHILHLFTPLKGQSFHAKVRRQGGDEIGTSTKVVLAYISLDRRMDQLESEITLLRQAGNHLQKNND